MHSVKYPHRHFKKEKPIKKNRCAPISGLCPGRSLSRTAMVIQGFLRWRPLATLASLSLPLYQLSVCVYGHIAYNLIQRATFRLQKVKKQRERCKKRQKKATMRKEDKTLKREKPPHLVWGFFWAIFYYKTGEKVKFWPYFGPLIEVMAIYIYIYAVRLLSGPSLGGFRGYYLVQVGVIIWSKFVFCLFL